MELRYARQLAWLDVDGANINAEMINQGYAWAYTRYNADPELAKLQALAKAVKRGLWADSDPVPPWDFWWK